MDVRSETRADRARCVSVVAEAFATDGGAEPPEAKLLSELFGSAAYIPDLSIVAASDGVVFGHVISTRATIGRAPVLGLGPIAVLPAHQDRGIGSALMAATIERATAIGESTIVLLGDPHYYERFGFVRADALGIDPPEPWGRHFMVRPLGDVPPPQGPFEYAEPFRSL